MRPRRRKSKRVARPSFANGGSSIVRSPIAWRKPATGCSALRSCHRASGRARAPPTRSNDYTRSSSAGSKRRPCSPQQRLPPCCSGRCSPPVKSTCARSMAGRRSPQRPSIRQLTSPPETISSCRWRLRHIEFQHKARRHRSQGCVTLPLGESAVHFTPVAVKSQLPDAGTEPWPMGDVLPNEPLPPEIDAAKLKAAVEAAFEPPEALTAAFVVTWKGRLIAERYGDGV